MTRIEKDGSGLLVKRVRGMTLGFKDWSADRWPATQKSKIRFVRRMAGPWTSPTDEHRTWLKLARRAKAQRKAGVMSTAAPMGPVEFTFELDTKSKGLTEIFEEAWREAEETLSPESLEDPSQQAQAQTWAQEIERRMSAVDGLTRKD